VKLAHCKARNESSYRPCEKTSAGIRSWIGSHVQLLAKISGATLATSDKNNLATRWTSNCSTSRQPAEVSELQRQPYSIKPRPEEFRRRFRRAGGLGVGVPFCRDLSRYAGFLRQFLTDGLASPRKPRTGETAKTLLHIAPRFHCTPRFMPLAFLTAVLLGSAICSRKLQNGRGSRQNSVQFDCRMTGSLESWRCNPPVDQRYGNIAWRRPCFSAMSSLPDRYQQPPGPQITRGADRKMVLSHANRRKPSTFRKHGCHRRPSS
jgi:hypothetical protein